MLRETIQSLGEIGYGDFRLAIDDCRLMRNAELEPNKHKGPQKGLEFNDDGMNQMRGFLLL